MQALPRRSPFIPLVRIATLLAIGDLVPVRNVALQCRPATGTVETHHEGRGLRTIETARNVEKVFATIAGGDDRAVVAVLPVERSSFGEREQCRKRQDQKCRLHRCRFLATASGAAASRTNGTTRMATSSSQ
jgi:hypothetical protein